jgi:hypothetical protein
MKQRIPDEDFKLIKKYLPMCSNIHKPTKKTILEFYNEMNNAIDNLEFGMIDQEHPLVIKERQKMSRMAWNKLMSFVSSFADNPYFSGRRL